MRRIFQAIFTGIILGFVWTATASGAASVDLASRWEEDEPLTATLAWRESWRGGASDWEWRGKLYLTDPDDAYSSLGLHFGWDGRFQDLKFDLSSQWNDRYRLAGTGFSYQWQPWRGIKTALDYEAGLRMAAPDYDDRYRYHWDRQEFDFGFRFSDFSYGFQLTRHAKEYPEAEYYTSVKYHLSQEIAWEPRPHFKLTLGYDEYTGYYPYDESYPRDYWKENWGLRIAAGSPEKWRTTYSFDRLVWIQAYDPYREDRRFAFKLQNPSRSPLRFALKIGIADLAYFSNTIYDDPEEEGEEEEDLNSRWERKLSFVLGRRYEVFQWELEYFGRTVDYRSSARADLWETGLSTTLEWNWRRYSLQLDIAPWGSFSDRDATCKMIFGYRSK
jgi:hypothetical protein